MVNYTDIDLLEPEHGVFTVTPIAGDEKAGKFVTIDGQPVFIGGPSQGGGSAGGGGGGTDLARVESEYYDEDEIDTIITVLDDHRKNKATSAMIAGFEGDRHAIANHALYDYNQGMGDLVVVQSNREKKGEVVGVAELGITRWTNPYPEMQGQYREIPSFATKRRGFGRLTMNAARETARDEGVGIFLKAIPAAVPFYEAIGMRRGSTERVFYWTPEDIANA